MNKLVGSCKCCRVLRKKVYCPKWCSHIWITTLQTTRPKKSNFRKWIWMNKSIFRVNQSLYLKIHIAFLFRIGERKRKASISRTKDLHPFILQLQVMRNSKISKAINSSIMNEESFVKLLSRKFWLELQSTNLIKWWKKAIQMSKWKLKTYQSLHPSFKIPTWCCFSRNLRLKMKLALRIKLLKMKSCTKRIHRDTLTERSSSNSTFERKKVSKHLISDLNLVNDWLFQSILIKFNYVKLFWL